MLVNNDVKTFVDVRYGDENWFKLLSVVWLVLSENMEMLGNLIINFTIENILTNLLNIWIYYVSLCYHTMVQYVTDFHPK